MLSKVSQNFYFLGLKPTKPIFQKSNYSLNITKLFSGDFLMVVFTQYYTSFFKFMSGLGVR
ncbi:hypothetical protein WA1_21415 [Scytonema hofmannii PCC 7110]|uniref:Uncharacterized protein n=1 Tax=Scytonema hofmannii PCC 7110 TaxID=128403 RepID=A0A139XCU3_9CYAN|nr:hypothetical protein WA1_21415 [Scytonema hofmannii PCC 7110]